MSGKLYFRSVHSREELSDRRGLHAARCALTLLEVVVSTLIVGVMIVVALNSLGAVTRSSESFGNRAVALGLAEDLMAEILPVAYSDPDEDPVFGRESSESASPRTEFDDVDDFHNWSRQPPQARDGTPMVDRDDWLRRVTVERVAANDPTQVATGSTDTGVKRIHVFVEYKGEVLVELIAVRADTEP